MEFTPALEPESPLEPELEHESSLEPAEEAAEEPIVVDITDVIDLHSFLPAEIRDVVRDYLDAAYERGLRQVRLIHGRGVGVQRRSVRALLARDPRVVTFDDAPPEAGGRGATLVTLE